MSSLEDAVAVDATVLDTQFAEQVIIGMAELDDGQAIDIIKSKSSEFWRVTCKAVFEGQKEINSRLQRRSISIQHCSTPFKLRATYRRPGRPNRATLALHPRKNYISISDNHRGSRMYRFLVSRPGADLLVIDESGRELDSDAVAGEFLDILTARSLRRAVSAMTQRPKSFG